MRNVFLKGLHELAKQDDRIVAILADNGLIVFDDFRRDFPDRNINFGIAEANMVAEAAGMASVGLIPYCYTINAFLAYRAYEFIRDDVCLQEQNVKIVGIGTGLTYSVHGPSHHTTEDIALLRSIPGLTVFSPATRMEAAWIARMSYEIQGAVYIRLGNNNIEHHSADPDLKIGVPALVKDGKDIAILTTGPILNVAVEAAAILKDKGIDAAVYSLHTLKPSNTSAIADIGRRFKKLVTLEEHNIIGGLFSLVSETLMLEGVCSNITPIGLDDSFAKGYGTLDELRAQNGLDVESVCRKIKGIK